jgi:thiamine-phosphate pyrophosphorylase
VLKKNIYRVIDANLNRSKEGLRVIEDTFRFIIEDDKLRQEIRNIRHCLDSLKKIKLFKLAIFDRDSEKDLGSKLDVLELNRKNYFDILYVNFQRVKESLRVMEEFLKVICPAKVKQIKKLRYDIYAVERKAFIKYFKNV